MLFILRSFNSPVQLETKIEQGERQSHQLDSCGPMTEANIIKGRETPVRHPAKHTPILESWFNCLKPIEMFIFYHES